MALIRAAETKNITPEQIFFYSDFLWVRVDLVRRYVELTKCRKEASKWRLCVYKLPQRVMDLRSPVFAFALLDHEFIYTYVTRVDRARSAVELRIVTGSFITAESF